MTRRSETVEVEDQVAAEVPIEVEAAPEIIPSAVTPEPEAKKTAVVVVSGMTIPEADIRIVVESRKYSGSSDGQPLTSEVKKSHYPKGADLYVRYDPEVTFPADAAEVLTIGDNVLQHNFWGFTRQVGSVNVGPAHAAFAAANLAYQRGATHIEIIGLDSAEKERLQPFFDRLSTDPVEPAKVAVSLT